MTSLDSLRGIEAFEVYPTANIRDNHYRLLDKLMQFEAPYL